MISHSKRKLGGILLDQKYITEDQLAQGIEKQKISKKRLGEILTELGFVTHKKLTQALAVQLGKLIPETFTEVPSTLIKTKKLGEILLSYSLITKEQLAKGIGEQKRTNRRMGEVLTEMGFVTEEKLARALSAQLGIPYIDLNTVVVEPEAIDLLPERLARKTLALPLTVDRKFVTVVMSDPLDFEAIHDISFATNREVRPAITPIKEIKAAIRRFYHLSQPLEKILGEIKGGTIEVISDLEANQEAETMEEVAKKVVPSLREIIAKEGGEEAILKAGIDAGMRYMSDDGMEKVNQGITTVAELLRVIYVREEDAGLQCPNCGESVRKDFPNCPYCGYVLADKCGDCGAVRDPSWHFCPQCGKKVSYPDSGILRATNPAREGTAKPLPCPVD